jgi:membrane protein involved in colicin uptake
MAKKKAKAKKKPAKQKSKAAKKPKAKAAVKTKQAAKKKVAAKPKAKTTGRKVRGGPAEGELVSYGQRGLGARTAGQSGDTQGIRRKVDVDSESVEELLEEGQSFEAEVVDGVENAPDPDQGEVRTHEVEEDDVPDEYLEKD